MASDAPSYAGHDTGDVPHYAHRIFTNEERTLLRGVYGIEDPSRLYVSDSSDAGLLEYDTARKRCRTCYVNSYRIGFISVRRPGESWDAAERRITAMRPKDFSSDARQEHVSTADLDPDIRGDVDAMLADAARAGFKLRIAATYRSPAREAFLMARGGRTHTLTSLHAYGRAVDILVGDGNAGHAPTRAAWIAFRRWVTAYRNGEFRILGTPSQTWDWAHVEVPSATVGFHDIDAALARARVCRAVGKPPCDFAPHLPAQP